MVMALVNLAAFLMMLLVNFLATTGRLGGYTTEEISSQYNNLFTPAGWTFSIWGVIYILLLIFVVASFFNASAKKITGMLGNWFWISCLFNMLWLVMWHQKLIWLSMIMMVGLLISVIVLSIRLNSISNIFSAGFSVYVGWISVATIANFVVLMTSLGMDGMGNFALIFVTAALPLVALIMSVVVYFKLDWIYGLTGLFAYAGILSRQISVDGLSARYPAIITATIVGFIIIAFATAFILVYGKAFTRFAFFKNT